MPLELNCVNCGEKFYCYPSEAANGRKYCGLECRGNHLNRQINPASRTPVGFTCKECGKPFTMMQAHLKSYRKKFNRDPLYCSIICSQVGRRKSADERNKFVCKHCNKLVYRTRSTTAFRIYREQKYCSQACKSAASAVAALDRFNSGDVGRHIKKNGYVWLAIPSLANNGKKTEMLEHRYVMSQHLGRELYPEETVHHRDGNRQHNLLPNLELFSSRHGPGQRVVDKVQFAIDILRLYPDFARAAGVELRTVEHISDAPPPHETHSALI